jgi:hypothetical protein
MIEPLARSAKASYRRRKRKKKRNIDGFVQRPSTIRTRPISIVAATLSHFSAASSSKDAQLIGALGSILAQSSLLASEPSLDPSFERLGTDSREPTA